MSTASVWTLRVPIVDRMEAVAERVEAQGWDGMVLTDSQNLAADVYAALILGARATERIGLGTGVTNPVTRHPAVTAGAIHTVQHISGGRAMLGIGRGDSSLFRLGRTPAPVADFERYLAALQPLLAGEKATLEGHETRMAWIQGSLASVAKVPLDVAATGPRVIRIAARLADCITFALGADPDRLRWGIAIARGAREEAGLDPDGIRFGAYVNCAPHPDRSVARELARGGIGTFAHFSGMSGSSADGVRAEDRAVFESIHASYDRANHTLGRARHAQGLDDAFLDRFGAVGTAAECCDRFREMVAAGIERFVVTGASMDSDRDAGRLSGRLFLEEVLPAVQQMKSS